MRPLDREWPPGTDDQRRRPIQEFIQRGSRFASRQEFGTATGVDPGQLSRAFAGRADLSIKALQKVLEVLHARLVIQTEEQARDPISIACAGKASASAWSGQRCMGWAALNRRVAPRCIPRSDGVGGVRPIESASDCTALRNAIRGGPVLCTATNRPCAGNRRRLWDRRTSHLVPGPDRVY
jgi:hypothetical protein